jgi:hypothetical protein
MFRLLILFWLLLYVLPAAEADGKKLSDAIEKALAAIAKAQRDDGSTGERGTASVAMAGMAFLAGGHTPDRGQYREASEKCLKFVIDSQDPISGYLGKTDQMYAHGFATLYLAEAYGMCSDPRVRRALEAGLDCIYRSQHTNGGWGYDPAPGWHDISLTICQVMAIRAAYNAGIGGERSQDAMAKAVGYVRGCFNRNGTFSYIKGQGSGTGIGEVPRCAAGTMCLIGAGITTLKDPMLGPALTFLRSNVIEHLRSASYYLWYGQYYAAQAMFHSPDPKDWERYQPEAIKDLLATQSDSGQWVRSPEGGPIFATGVATIILQIDNQYLPIFQK